jgi:methanogenic corrinoid protein MtbC1
MGGLTEGGPKHPAKGQESWKKSKKAGQVKAGDEYDPQIAQNGAEERLAQLVRTIEGEIIPRLMLAHRADFECPKIPTVGGAALATDDVEAFAKLVLAHDVAIAAAYVQAMHAQGATLETLYLELLAPTARRLGELWEADLCDFTDVTVGLGRLQQLLRELGPLFRQEGQVAKSGRRALLVPAAGEQHTLGLLMVAEFFRKSGWGVWSEPTGTSAEVVRIVRNEWFDIAGFSVGTEHRLADLKAEIAALRQASRNKSIQIMVGGPFLLKYPDCVSEVGADGSAMDAKQAVIQAESLAASSQAR